MSNSRMSAAASALPTEGCPVAGHSSPSPDVRIGALSERGDVFRYTRAPLLTLRRGPDRRIPGPKGLPVLGVVPQFARDPFTYLVECQRRYGDVFRLPLPVWDGVAIAHPDLVKEVMHDHGERFGVFDVSRRVERVVGVPFPFLDGKRYSERRKIIAPMFGKRYLADLSVGVFDEFAARIDEWDRFADSGEVIDLEHELGRATLPGFLKAMYSTSVSDEQLARYDHDLRTALLMVASAWWMRPPFDMLPIPGIGSVPIAAARILREADRLLQERRRSGEHHADLLQVLADARLPDGDPVPRRSLMWDTAGIMVAGYETIVSALTWTFALLPTNPDAERRLDEEIDMLGGELPSFEDVDRMTWARACFDEGQRLQGNPFNMRFAKVDTELAGFAIPKGTFLPICMTVLHRDPRWWANPEHFDPTHFTDPEQVAARPKTAFIPFGTGPHQCVGMAMAYMNGVFLMARILQRYRIHQLPGWTPRHKATTSVTIKGGFPCTLTRR